MDRSELFRLVLTKRFLEEAQANVRRGDAQSLAVAVVDMHDALDNLLGTLATHLAVHVPDDTTMLRAYDRIGAAGHSLGSRTKVDQLNAVRNDVKHQGLHPNPAVVRDLVPELAALADEWAVRFLGKDLKAIHLIDAIHDNAVRADMSLIWRVIESGDFRNALEQMAFVMFKVYEESTFGPLRWARQLALFRSGERGEEFEFPEIDRTERRLAFVELGLDPQEYDVFHRLVPRVGVRAGSDTAYVLKKNRHTWHSANWTRENCDRVFDFLLRVILAKEDRPGRPPITSLSPVDKITFLHDSALFEDRACTKPVAEYHAGDATYALALPFVDGAWQNHGEELVYSNFLIDGEWEPAYLKKQDVEVTPDVPDPEREA